MTYILLYGKETRLKKYTAQVSGSQSVVKIEISVKEPGSLGFLLEDLGRIEAEQIASDKAAKAAERKAKAPKPLALPAPLKQIPYFEED